ncbi:MAG: outer membrane lipoprotein carrier protein LolA [Chitinophagaceae bacterium]
MCKRESGRSIFYHTGLLSFLLIIVASISSNAQYTGYRPLPDLTAFKNQFTAAAQKINSIKSDFQQEKNLSMLSEKIISKGKFWFKKDNLVRMEYNQPFQYLMIINKNNVFVKDGQKENTISTKSNKLFQQINKITVDCVQGTMLTNPDFKIRVFENNKAYLIEMTPSAKGLKEYFKNINVVVDKTDYSVIRIDMQELSGDNTIINFTNKELNVTIPDALFVIR